MERNCSSFAGDEISEMLVFIDVSKRNRCKNLPFSNYLGVE